MTPIRLNNSRNIFIQVIILSIALAFMESAVVIYLRDIIYPEGFKFPLNPIRDDLILTEILREASTLIILVFIGLIAARTFSHRFAYFLLSFAVWDIFYYVFLKLLIGWPESIFTWDILFLIPTTWTGPVITPVIVSFTFILISVAIIFFTGKASDTRILLREWGIFIIGCTSIFLSFIWDYSMFILRYFSFKEIFIHPDKQSLYNIALTYVPVKFNWGMFFFGEFLLLLMIILYSMRIRRRM